MRITSLSTIAAAAVFVGSAGPAMAFATSIPSGSANTAKPLGSGMASISNMRSNSRVSETSTTQLNAINPLAILRGGASTTGAEAVAETFFDSSIGQALSSTFATSTPTGLFNAALAALALTTVGIKTAAKLGDANNGSDDSAAKKEEKPKEIKTLQMKFLSVFWLLRLSDWLQGPYFYEGECPSLVWFGVGII